MKKKTFLILPGVISILLMGVILTTLAFQYFRWEIRDSVRRQMEEDASVYTGMITNKVNHYITLMESMKNFFKFSGVVTRDEFTGFTTMMLAQEPGVKTLCWAPQVKPSQRLDYEMNARKEGFLRFAFYPDQNRGQASVTSFFPAYYVEPLDKNSSIFGRILSSESRLSKAFEKAVKTGQPTSVMNPLATVERKPVNFNNECWIIIPVFEQHGLSFTEQGRYQSLCGYLLGIIDVPSMMHEILKSRANMRFPVEFHIEDVTGRVEPASMPGEDICCTSGFDRNKQQIVTENRINFVDRAWKIYCVANEKSPFQAGNAWMTWLVFPVGLLLTGLLVLYLYTLYCRNELAGNLVEKRTRELKEQKEKADAIAIEAERSNRAKSAFLAGMSHDIRTPMNVILGFCELLAEESLSKDQKFYVNTIHSNSKNLLMLLNDILDLSKIEAGKLHIDLREFDPKEMLDSIELMFRASTQNRGLELRIIFMNRIPQMIQSDPLRIRQCLVNLIGNAIKFTHQGHIYVSVCYENERLKLSVEDTGVGIPQERLESIFNAFGTGGRGSDPEMECGTGLGLAITRQLARLMGGDVTVQSQVGKGSVFTLDIPVDTAKDKMETIFHGTGIKDGWGDI